VALPHTWGSQGLPLSGSAQYRLQFQLAGPAEGVWALRVDRLSNVHSVRVNGVLIHQAGLQGVAVARPRPVPVLATFPAQLLRPGDNEIDVQWRLGLRAGLSDARVGPAEPLRAAFERDRLFEQTVPQLMNVAGAALAAFMLLIWWRRRRERAIGLFGALWLLVSLRNYSYFVDSAPLPGLVGDWLYFAAQCVSAALLGAFAVALAGPPRPRFTQLLWAMGVALPVLGVGGVLLGHLDALRAVVYPFVVLLSAASLWVLWQSVRRATGREMAYLLVGLGVVLLAGVHDYLFLRGWMPVTHFFWLPDVVPLACMWFALRLVNRLVGALGASEDLAQALETRVAERTRALEEANQSKSRFLAAASHDLRQPVTAIGLLVGMARERTQDAALGGLLDRVQAAAKALEVLLRGLLDLSRLETEAAKPKPEPVALQPLFDGIGAHAQSAAADKGLRLRLRPTSHVVQSDPVLLEQVLRNLVDNAVRYTQRGGVLVAARAQGDGSVRVQVWDSGCGIAPQDQARIFEAFVQLGNPGRDRSQGQGLGLAIVRRAVDLLGHPLALRSQPGTGSCFTIVLPRAPAHGPVPPAPTPAQARPLAGQVVWLLEDNEAIREALGERLRDWGAQVRLHACVAELAQSLSPGTPCPDLLVTDHRLPDGNALGAIQRAQAHFGPLRTVVLTGDSTFADRAALEAMGIPVLIKPLPPTMLLQHLAGAPPRR
jgi:signal transduction histidine kinase/CheY-like chemotaxis protein